jgi:hypothetical protein
VNYTLINALCAEERAGWRTFWRKFLNGKVCPSYVPFLVHLQEREAHMSTAMTPATHRAIELAWRYTTDPHLPPRAAPDFRSREDPDEQVWDYMFKDDTGKVVSGRGTLKEMEMYEAALRRQAEGKEGNNDGGNAHREA